MIKDIGFQEPKLIDGHIGSAEVGKKVGNFFFEGGNFILVRLPYLFR